MHDQGLATPADPTQAFQWFKKAADISNADAQNALGLAYGQGRGVARDTAAARSGLEKAQQNGNAAAAQNLRMLQ